MAGHPEGASGADAPSLHRRGKELLSAGQTAAALAQLEHAVALDPGNPQYLNALGNAQRAAGALQEAISSYRRALESRDGYGAALYNLGVSLQESGSLEEAEQFFRQLTQADGSDGDALFRLGSVLGMRGRLGEAAKAYRQALELQPDNPYLWLCLGQAENSIECFLKCLDLKPDLPEAHQQLGLAYSRLGRADDAMTSFREALRLAPELAEAHDGLASLLQDAGRLDEAIAHHEQAIRSSPENAAYYNNLGCALARRLRLAEALDCLRRATELRPDYPPAHLNLGNAASIQGERAEALRSYEAALRLEPGNASAREALLFEMQKVCDWSRLEELCESQRRAIREKTSHPIAPFSLLSIPCDRAEQLLSARSYAQAQLRATERERRRLAFTFALPRPKPTLTIGYLSADLHEHPTAYLMAELFELHDRTRFKVTAYSYGPDDGSAMRTRLVRAFERFVDVSAYSHADAAAAIYADGVDILVDLKGYTQHARTEIMALRPAPIQASYIGYPGTMGAAFIDYLIADRVLIPPDHADDYAEELVLMPGSYQVNDRKRPAPKAPPRAALGLSQDAFVFCCFNQSYKILPDVFAAWMRLLAAVPESVLWLLEENRWASENLRREARVRGIDPGRLVFAPKVPLERHLARIGAADLFLDTHPCNAHTTASDALWAGLPLVTCLGETFASRVAGSLLTAAGLSDLVTRSLGDYEALALQLAGDRQRLGRIRARLGSARSSAALFDTPTVTKNLEAAYSRMWEIYCRGGRPQSIDLSGGG